MKKIDIYCIIKLKIGIIYGINNIILCEVNVIMKKIDLEKLSSVVSKRRKEKDMTQDQLGELTGINRQVIGRIELGKTVPSLNQLQQLLDVLDIDFDSILEDKQTEDVFMAMRGEARTVQERKGLETMISMMLCLKKHEQLRRVYNG